MGSANFRGNSLGYPIFKSKILARVRDKVIANPFAHKVGRKAGLRIVPASDEVPHVQPTPILSLEGTKTHGGHQGGCSVELQDLIWAFRNDGSFAEDELIAYIEDHLGQTIAEAFPTEWAEVLATGEDRTVVAEIPPDEVTIRLKYVEGDTLSCEHLPTHTFTLTDNDYSMEVYITGLPPTSPTALPTTIVHYVQYPDYAAHVEDPEVVWLSASTTPAVTSGVFGVSVDGVMHFPFVKIRAHYTQQIAHIRRDRWTSVGGVPTVTSQTWEYTTNLPLLGFKSVVRIPSESGLSPNETDPLRLGTISASAVINSDFVRAANLTLATSGEFWLKTQTSGVPSTGVGLSSGTADTDSEAWSLFLGVLGDYNALATASDPTITLDEADKSVAVSYMTDANALYIPFRGCQADEGADEARYTAIAVNYGGRYYDGQVANLATDNSTSANDYLDGLQERIIRKAAGTPPDASDPGIGTAQTEFYRQLPAGGPDAMAADVRCITPGPP